MPVTFFTLPQNVREKVYEYVWCGNLAHIVEPDIKKSLGREGVRFPEDIEARYPPPEDEDEDEEEEDEEEESRDGNSADEEEDEEEDEDWQNEANSSTPNKSITDPAAKDISSETSNKPNDSEEQSSLEAEASGQRYKLQSLQPLNTSLLKTSRNLNIEALPIFYSTTTFLFDATGSTVLNFLRNLPDRARNSIAQITLTSATMLMDDGDDEEEEEAFSGNVWTGSMKFPKTTDPPMMITSMGAFLSSKLPALEIISFYFPFGGGEDGYPTWAPTELLILLWHRKISLLNFIFLGKHVAATLRESSGSEECYEILMGDWGEDAEINLGEHIFELKNPAPSPEEGEFSVEEFRERCRVYFAARDEFAKEIDRGDEGLIWEWGDRRVEMGGDGNVQAVVSMWMTAEGEEHVEGS